MAYSIKHVFHINAVQENIFKALSSVEGLKNWWTVKTEGNTDLLGELQFDFGDFIGPKMRITALTKNDFVEWTCVESKQGWLGHKFTFRLHPNKGKTRIQFEHAGWSAQDQFFGECSFSWGRYLESLRQYCQTGQGEAHGAVGYRK